MQATEVKKAPKTKQKVQLVKGDFTPSEAWDIIGSLVDVKINFHKLQRLQRWEGYHKCDTGDLNSRIEELQQAEAEAKEFIAQVRKQGKKVSISGTLEIKVTE
ncbi:hypothetical protein [Robiginitalea sp. SC105]|uniref:hypothetical protein n=1 Tax=Robiginitalea sp. SC105 TaxID=2762332 RepID=UPI001639D358|nr:hypothetical protein [Robiginitalea sp. SC105]MBC2838458.1 hypothetical protein [Robiginitalea sp. SC105]